MDKRTQIALIVPSTSRNKRYDDPANIDLTCRLCESLYPKIQDDYDYALYLGYDRGDAYYGTPTTSERLRSHVAERYPRLRFRFLQIPEAYPLLAHKWNYLYETAYRDGLDYFYQLGDDILILDAGWEDDFIGKLKANDDLGVTGPIDINYVHVLTASFVGRRHYEIFGYYYPPVFNTWYADDWITEVYTPNYRYWSSRKIRNFHVPPRYDDAAKPIPGGRSLQQIVEEERQKIADHVGDHAGDHAEKGPARRTGRAVVSQDRGPLVSVVMPARNCAGHLLDESMDSILRQTHENLELLIMDGASEDDTQNAIRRKSEKDKRIRYHRSPERLGPGGARMAGIRLARGDYIALMDAGDISCEQRLELQLDHLLQRPDTDACACLFDDSERGSYFYPAVSELSQDMTLLRHATSTPFYLGAFTMFRKQPLLNCGYRDFFADGMEDVDLTLRFQERYKAGLVAENLYRYRGYSSYDPEWPERRPAASTNEFFLFCAAYMSAYRRRWGLPDKIPQNFREMAFPLLNFSIPLERYWMGRIIKHLEGSKCRWITQTQIEDLIFLGERLQVRGLMMKTLLKHCRPHQIKLVLRHCRGREWLLIARRANVLESVTVRRIGRTLIWGRGG